jgi:hypothetical protein
VARQMQWTEKGFGLNDYFVIAAIILSWSIYFYLPKVFSKQITILIFLYTMVCASIFDNSLGADPFDLYDIMDGPDYTGMDLMIYLLYPPAGYIFLFVVKTFDISGRFIILYITLATFVSICFEWVYFKMNVFHYKNGYQMVYSICVYLLIQSLFILFYRLIKSESVEVGKTR